MSKGRGADQRILAGVVVALVGAGWLLVRDWSMLGWRTALVLPMMIVGTVFAIIIVRRSRSGSSIDSDEGG
jgi:hypothetical protein